MSWAKAIAFVFHWEGGYSDDPDDDGGRTNMGITQAVLSAAYTAKIVSHNDVRKLTKAEATAIYQARYWNPYQWDQYGEPVDMILFDMCVNNGPGNMAKLAQRACVSLGQNIVIDGKWGPKTRAALYALAWSKGAALSKMLLVKRLNFYEAIVMSKPSKRKYLSGWRNRTNDLARKCGIRLP
ncbi:MAG: N-acetylmuramidase [Synergistes sp.]|nr:N-acetylmuramidase [Synergistes sp.]